MSFEVKIKKSALKIISKLSNKEKGRLKKAFALLKESKKIPSQSKLWILQSLRG